MNHKLVHLHEKPGVGRLGRHVEHDERSRCFAAPMSAGPLVSVDWVRHCDPFDQGDVGSCTGNAMAGACMTGPVFDARKQPYQPLNEADALRLYEAATRLDKVPGFYPPDDTGSSGLAVAKAAQREKLISAYHHAFGLSAALHALSRGPVIIGISWYDTFDRPIGTHAELLLTDDAENRGGHEIVLDGIDVKAGFVKGTNSWGTSWGNRGKFVMSFGTFGELLKQDGDVVVPVPR